MAVVKSTWIRNMTARVFVSLWYGMLTEIKVSSRTLYLRTIQVYSFLFDVIFLKDGVTVARIVFVS